jgi:hypothetical protein
MQTINSSAKPAQAGATAALHAENLLNVVITKVSRLAEASAKVLGLNAADAISVRESGLIAVDSHTVTIIPISTRDDGFLSVLLSVDTGRSVKDCGAAGVAAVLQHAPGALASFSATINTSTSGNWMIHRSVMIEPDRAQSLAEEIVCSARLADFVLGSADSVLENP